LMQSLAPRWIHRPAWRAARVHLANGLYINAWFNRLVGAQRRDERAIPSNPIV
jgi:NAD(P)H-quinone oxidoreductase subunit 5